MVRNTRTGDISELLRSGLAKARLKFLKEEAKNDETVVISDKSGKIKHVPAKELLLAAQRDVK